jgi:hypothetical protein
MSGGRCGLRHCLFDRYLKADLLEALDQAARTAIGMQAVIVIAAKFLIHSAFLDNVPGDD